MFGHNFSHYVDRRCRWMVLELASVINSSVGSSVTSGGYFPLIRGSNNADDANTHLFELGPTTVEKGRWFQ